jgi:subtilisin-like proprotein convertase family protein
MLILARALAVAACLLPLAVPAAADAALDLSHVRADVVEVEGNGDDVVGPGDRVTLRETVSTASALSGASATIFTPTPGVNLTVPTAPYAAAAAGAQSVNTRPFEAVLAANLPCGANLSFALAMAASEGDGGVNFTVPTGTVGPLKPNNGPVDRPIAAGATTDVNLDIAEVGRVKKLQVRIGSLTHPRLSDLSLQLVAPDGHVTVLAAAGTLAGTSLTSTTFADDGVSLNTVDPPYGARIAPVDPLADLVGRSLNGTWRLRVVDTGTGATGTLDSFALDASKAYCSGIPKARFAMDVSPPRISPGGTVKFDGGTSTDSGGSIVSYAWDLDGDGQFDDGTQPTAQRTYPVRGKYPVRLRVTDNDGLTDVETQNLAVTEPPTAAVTATPVNPMSGETVHLDASGSSDFEGPIVNYRWEIEDDLLGEHDTQGDPHLDVSFALSGSKAVKVTVTDEDGAEASKTIQVAVQDRPPTAALADPGLVIRDRQITLSAEASTDPEGGSLGYEWDLDGLPGYETSSNGLPTLDHTFTTSGPRTIGLKVTDDHGFTDTATVAIVVTRAPTAPVTATPNPVSLRRDVVLDVSGAVDPDDPNAVLTYEWDLDGNATDDFGASAPATQTTSWPTAGTRTVKVRVTDPSGAATVGTVDVVVRNMLPVATIAAAPIAPKVGEATQLSATGTDPDGTVVAYAWDLDGDGAYEKSTGTVPATSATFANAGNVTVGVRVTDDDGGTGVKTMTLTVATPPEDGGGDGDGGDGGTSTGGTSTGAGGGTTTGTTPPPGEQPAGPAPTEDEPTQPAGTPDPAPPTAERPFGAWVGGAAVQRTSGVVQKGLLVSCRSEVAVWCSLTATIAARDAKRLKLGRKDVVVAKTAVPVAEGTVVRLRLKLTAKARRALRGKGGVRVLVRAVAGAADGRKVALTRVVLLRR